MEPRGMVEEVVIMPDVQEPVASLAAQMVIPAALLIVAVFVVRSWWQRGFLRPESLDDGPDRRMGLGLVDIGAVIMLAICGAVMAMQLGTLWHYVAPHWYGQENGQLVAATDRLSLALAVQVQVLTFGMPVLYLLLRCGLPRGGMTRLGLWRPMDTAAWRMVWLGLLGLLPVVLILLIGAGLLGELLGDPPPTLNHEMLLTFTQTPDLVARLLVVLLAVVLAPLFEELLFRGMIQSALVEVLLGRRWVAIVLTSLFFAVIHLPSVTWHGLPGLFVLSMILGWTYERRGNLWIPIALHMGYNAVNLGLALLLVAYEVG